MPPPLTVAIVGYSGAGKTALVERIVPLLGGRGMTVGYLKAGAHSIDTDGCGKDTGRVGGAGAAAVGALTAAESRLGIGAAPDATAFDRALIEHASRCALWNTRADFAGCDLLLVEGMKFSALPKILVSRPGHAESVSLRESLTRVLAHLEWKSGGEPDTPAELAAAKISDLLDSRRQSGTAGITGVVLAGGAASRMGRDKALLPVGEDPKGGGPVGTWLERTFCLLVQYFDRVAIAGRSVAAGSGGLPLLKGEIDSFEDHRPGAGPLAGIETAFKSIASEAYLVVPCDMPLVTEELIELLIVGRSADAGANAFRSLGGTPYPFPAVFNEAALARSTSYLNGGGRKVLDFMESVGTHWLDLPADLENLLINVNSQEDLARLNVGNTHRAN
jgi:molybdopterin-guanine dinucleotide biosynthesis protein A